MKNTIILTGVLPNAAAVATACVQLAQDFVYSKPKPIFLNEAHYPNAQVSLAIATLGQCKKSACRSAQLWHLLAKVRVNDVSATKVCGFSSARSQSWALASYFQYEYEQRLHATK